MKFFEGDMTNPDHVRAAKEMDEWTKAVQARWTEDSHCEAPMCEDPRKSKVSKETHGLHKAIIAMRLKAAPHFEKVVEEHIANHKTKGEKPCYMDNLLREEGVLVCLCCAIQFHLKLIEMGWVPGFDGAFAIQPMLDMPPEEVNKHIEPKCSKQAKERLPLMVMAGEMARNKRESGLPGNLAGMVAINRSEIEEVLKRDGPEGVKRFIADRVSKDIAEHVLEDIQNKKTLKDGEVGAPISEEELKEIRRTLINDIDTLPTNIAGLIGRSDN